MKKELERFNRLVAKTFHYGDAGVVIHLPQRLILEDAEILEVSDAIENIMLKIDLGEMPSKLEILMLQMFKEAR